MPLLPYSLVLQIIYYSFPRRSVRPIMLHLQENSCLAGPSISTQEEITVACIWPDLLALFAFIKGEQQCPN